MKEVTKRFHDDETPLWSLGDLVLVECPRCKKCARVTRTILREPWRCNYRLTCGHCGCSRATLSDAVESTQPSLGIFMGCQLWLRTASCGRCLWALNEGHLDYLERYIAADLRERVLARAVTSVWNPCFTCGEGVSANDAPPDSGERHLRRVRTGYHLVSRLPRWMVLKSNREPVLKGLARMRTLIPAGGSEHA